MSGLFWWKRDQLDALAFWDARLGSSYQSRSDPDYPS